MNPMQQFLSDIAANIEKEGEVLKEYESLLSSICGRIDDYQMRLQRCAEYEVNNPKPKDDSLEWTPYMSDEEKTECRQFIVEATEFKKAIQELISDEINHTIVLSGWLVKLGRVRPSVDNLAQAIAQIVAPTTEEDNDDN